MSNRPARRRGDVDAPRGLWRLVASLFAVSVFVASCTSPSPSDSAERESDPQAALDAQSPTAIVFTNSNGSAFDGSQTIFTVTNVGTEESFLVPVFGAAGDTRTEVPVAPGTYRITSTDPHTSPTGSYVVNTIEPSEVTVAADDASTPPTEAVDFALDVVRSPFELRLAGVTATTVDLIWESLEGVDVSAFELRQTAGATAAASASEGTAVSLSGPDVNWASATGLESNTTYTFTLFASASSGESLATRSLTITTASAGGDAPAFALAPNTLVATDLAALDPRVVNELPSGWQRALGSGSLVEIELAALGRSSATEIPGVEPSQFDSGCVVGQPFLLSTEVAGPDAFYGLIARCRETTAIVNTDVPLAAVIPFLSIRHTQRGGSCFDASGTDLGPSAELCRRTDTDGDGIADVTERAFRLDPADAGDNWESLDTPASVDAAPPVDDLVAPGDLGSGEIQVTLLWSTGDDLDLHVIDPEGNRVFYDNKVADMGGRLDRDDPGDATCQSTDTRAENIFWDDAAPRGTYTVEVKNFRVDQGESPCGGLTQARLVVRVDGEVVRDQVVTVGADGPMTFGLAPSGVEVRVTSSTPDDLDLLISGAATVSTVTSRRDGTWIDPLSGPTVFVSHSSGDIECETIDNLAPSSESKYDLARWEEDDLPIGELSVVVRNEAGCNASVDALLEVWVRGELVHSEVLTVAGDSQAYSFSVAEEPPGFRRPATTATFVPPQRAAGSSAWAARQEGVGVECETEAGYEFTPGLGWEPFDDVEFDLKWGSLTWDIEAGIEVSLEPKLEFTGNATCALEVEGVSIQLMTQPVPVNLELTPAIDGEVEGTFSLAGPRLALTFGVASQGGVDASVEKCLFGLPCGIGLESVARAAPFGEFSHAPATVSVEATAQVNLGVEANLGIGLKNKFITGKVGLAVTMQPVSVEVTGSASVDTTGDAKACAAVNLGAKAGVDLVAEAFVLGWGADERFTILDGVRFEYPGAGFEIGACDEEEPPTTTTEPATTTSAPPAPTTQLPTTSAASATAAPPESSTSAPTTAEQAVTTVSVPDLQPEPVETIPMNAPIRLGICPDGFKSEPISPGNEPGWITCSRQVPSYNPGSFPNQQEGLAACQPPSLAAEGGENPEAIRWQVGVTYGGPPAILCTYSVNDQGLRYLESFS